MSMYVSVKKSTIDCVLDEPKMVFYNNFLKINGNEGAKSERASTKIKVFILWNEL